MANDARELAALLAQRAPALAAELLPQGHREGAEWRAGSLAGEPGQSLGVHLFGARAGVWCDFSSGEAGDALDLVAATKFGNRIPDAMNWARAWLGQASGDGQALPASQRSAQRRPAEDDPDAEARRRKALSLFLEAQSNIVGTPVAAYLVARGIDLGELGRVPRALRFHPACWCSEAAQKLPAMLGAITSGEGVHVATHRTWLARPASGVWSKAALNNAKKTLGSYAGGFIPLQRGATGTPMRTAPQGETVGIAEGIETALSVALACPELRVIAAVSLGNMARLALPRAVSNVIICADDDGPDNHAAARALASAVERFAKEGRQVRVARPPVGKDFNDTLTAGGRA